GRPVGPDLSVRVHASPVTSVPSGGMLFCPLLAYLHGTDAARSTEEDQPQPAAGEALGVAEISRSKERTTSRIRVAGRRPFGAEIEMAATGPSAPKNTGAATHRTPASDSSMSFANPSVRIRAISRASASGRSIVRSV